MNDSMSAFTIRKCKITQKGAAKSIKILKSLFACLSASFISIVVKKTSFSEVHSVAHILLSDASCIFFLSLQFAVVCSISSITVFLENNEDA